MKKTLLLSLSALCLTSMGSIAIGSASYYASAEEFLEAEGDTCQAATDGCNTIQISNGELGISTMMYCEDIYGENGQEQWSCIDQELEESRIGFMSESDKKLYYMTQEKLGASTDIIEEAIFSYGDKVLLKHNYDVAKSINTLEQVIDRIDTLLDQMNSSHSDTNSEKSNRYYILHNVSFELQITIHRWKRNSGLLE